MHNPALFVLIFICVGVWFLFFINGNRDILEKIKDISSKLDDIADRLGEVEQRLPEVDCEARDEEELRTDKQRWHEEEKELIKRLPEAISLAQRHGFAVELGSMSYHPEDGNWGETHVPICRVRRGESSRYLWPVDFVTHALLDGLSENEAMRNGAYPYNQAGQAQLEGIFASGIAKS
jgi:hypothetical protein